MNGPDLKFLAERASALDDRTPERLTEVHDRIATLRRRRRATTAAGVAALVVALVVGLALLDDDLGRKTPSPAPTPSPTPGFDPIGSAPKRGTCWAVPADVGYTDDADWYDDSPRVPCDAPHTTETAGYLFLTTPTVAEAKDSEGRCFEIVRGYLGVGPESWIPWAPAMFLPSREEIADGARWVRCDAIFPKAWTESFSGARTLTASVELIAKEPPLGLRACFDEPPQVDQPFVPCDRPHRYEQTGTLALISLSQAYPSVAERRAGAQQQCLPDVPGGVTGMSVTAAWDSEASFEPGRELAGACFYFRSDGGPLPGR